MIKVSNHDKKVTSEPLSQWQVPHSPFVDGMV